MDKRQEKIEAAKLYLEEWKHRDKVYNRHTFTYFFAVLLISVFPYIKFTNIISDKLNQIIKPSVFHIIAILLSIIAMFVSISLGKRLTCVSKKYNEILGYIDKEYTHIKVKGVFQKGVVSILSCCLFFIMIIFNLVFLFMSY